METIEQRAQKYLDATPGWSAADIHKVMAGFAKSERRRLEAALRELVSEVEKIPVRGTPNSFIRKALAKAKALLDAGDNT